MVHTPRFLRSIKRAARKLIARHSPPIPHLIGHQLDSKRPTSKQRARAKASDHLSLDAWSEGRYVHPRFVYHIEYDPPGPGVVFVSVCNDKYAPGLEALVLSLIKQYPGFRNPYIVYHDDGLSPFVRRRLTTIYPHFQFEARRQSKYEVALGDSPNHRRVGLLGYLSLEALELAAERIVILDTDLLVLGDISPLWKGSSIKASLDVGVKPYGIVSARTGKPIINSGVLSLPGSSLGERAIRRRDEVLMELANNDDKDIERFADQRFWNVFLTDQDVELLPQNFNCVKSLVTTYFAQDLAYVSILHLTGAKPWYSFLNEDLLSAEDRDAFHAANRRYGNTFSLWNARYRSSLLDCRLTAYRADQNEILKQLHGSLGDRPVVLIGNGPSLQNTDLNAFAHYEKVVFNWFIHHADWDQIRPDHLVVASHMLFGGWNTPRPELPEAFVRGLTHHTHTPRLWFSYYFKEYVEQIPELKRYPISYFFFEKPFKKKVAHSGHIEFNLLNPLTDSNTGVLTVGVPMAVHMGAKNIVLVGCDSNYSSTQGSYFYPAEEHVSKTTAEGTLLKTWADGGEGVYGYAVAQRQLRSIGINLHDATIGGRLLLPKLSLDQVRALAPSPQ